MNAATASRRIAAFFMDRCWILVGMMGAGKSAAGRALAERSGRPFRDTDTLVQNRLGRSVSQIFSFYGEPAFRDHEHSILREMEPEPVVLATGGGIVLRDDNWTEMNRLGPVVYLRATADELVRRLDVSRRKRPLLETDDWQGRVRELLAAREERYRRADHVLDVGEGEIDDVAARLESLFRSVPA